MEVRFLPYAGTLRFSQLATDYLAGKESLNGLYAFRPDAEGLQQAIEERKRFPLQRETLKQVLLSQYEGLPEEQKLTANIASLSEPGTFTVCTAHQPNLATGYLYFVYKIIHAIRLAEDLKGMFPDYHFVPVYYMGSEDADLEELGTFRFRGKKFVWDAAGQQGAVGRMNTASLAPLLQELFALIGPPGPDSSRLEDMLRAAYLGEQTIAAATRSLVHALFGRYGLVVLDADHAALKQAFLPVLEAELLEQKSRSLVEAANAQLTAAGYTPQAYPRDINLFYLKDDLRGRIERQGEEWKVHGTAISWSRAALLEELHARPERFSPNVVLRPLFQESILPNVAFIGGGAELAYWMQLKALFAEHSVCYPVLFLRQSVLWITAQQQQRIRQLQLSDAQLFQPRDEAFRAWLAAHETADWHLDAERQACTQLIGQLQKKAASIDPTLQRSAAAVLAKVEHQFTRLEAKMLRALKRKHETVGAQLDALLQALFPGGGLAERQENFMPYYLDYGEAFIETLFREMQPLRSEFMIVADTSPEA